MAIGFVIIPVYFVEKGLSIELTGLVIGIIGLPVVIKFIWGGIVDHFIRFGRKIFIIIGGILIIIGFFAVVFIDPSIALIPQQHAEIQNRVLSFLSMCGTLKNLCFRNESDVRGCYGWLNQSLATNV